MPAAFFVDEIDHDQRVVTTTPAIASIPKMEGKMALAHDYVPEQGR